MILRRKTKSSIAGWRRPSRTPTRRAISLIEPVRSQCHRNSSALWLTDTKRYRLVTGYSMTWDEDGLGVWRQHTWVFDTKTKRILETTEKRDIYFGYELSWDEAQAFAWENP